MAFIRKEEHEKHSREVTVHARGRIPIIGGPSREALRDALGVGCLVTFFVEILTEQKCPELDFTKSKGLKADVTALKWVKRDLSLPLVGERSICFLRGDFVPMTDGFNKTVYWGSYFCKYNTASRKGDLSITVHWTYDRYIE